MDTMNDTRTLTGQEADGPLRHSGPRVYSGTPRTEDGSEMSIIGLVNVLLRRRRLVLSVSVAIGGLALLFAIWKGDYKAESEFSPQQSLNGISRYAGIAAEFGFNVAGLSGDESVQFYRELVKSRHLLEEVVRTDYVVATGSDPIDTLRGSLIQILRIKGETPDEQLRRAVDLADRRISASEDVRAGIVTVATRAPWPELAERINRRTLDLVNAFNLEKRQSRASAERQFVEGRLAESQHELEDAEAELRRFLERNRRYQDSPQLAFEAARLQRRVDLRQQVYTSLAQAYEQSRIDEVRNTPVITIVDPPEGSARPRMKPVPFLLGGIVLGLVLGILLAFAAEHFAWQRDASPAEYAELKELGGTAVSGLSPARMLAALRSLRRR